MEAQLDDIRDRITLNSIRKLANTIVESAKQIKSNDATFKISTLPTVRDKLIELMEKYEEILAKTDLYQKTFQQLCDNFDSLEDDLENYHDLNKFDVEFDQLFERAKVNYQHDKSAHNLLNRVLGTSNDEEVQVEAPIRQIPKDPITKRDIEHAVRSRICKHVFDKKSIEDYIQQSEANKAKTIKCPMAGCTNKKLSMDQIQDDDETNELIRSL